MKTSDKLPPETYNRKIESIGGTIEEKRFELAELAWQAKQEDLPNWASQMAMNRYVKRSERTVREYAQVAELRAALPRHYDLPYTFYVRSLRFADRLPTEVIIDALEQAEIDNTTTAEDYSKFLSDKANPYTPPPFNLADWLADEYERSLEALNSAEQDDDIDCVKRIAEMLDAERARLGKKRTPRYTNG